MAQGLQYCAKDVYMDDLFDDPGDLGFFYQDEDEVNDSDDLDNDFYEPCPEEGE